MIKNSLLNFWLCLIKATLLLILPFAAIAQTSANPNSSVVTTVEGSVNNKLNNKDSLSLQDGKIMGRKEFNALKSKLGKLFETANENLNFDTREWVYYQGNLKINGNFLNSNKGIIVDGNLIIDGLYNDDNSALVVVGNMQAQNIVSKQAVFVTGDLTCNGIVFASFNKDVFEIGKTFSTNVLFNDNNVVSSKNLKAQFNIIKEDNSEKKLLELARHVKPELYLNNFYLYGSFPNKDQSSDPYTFSLSPVPQSILEFTKINSNIFRQSIASEAAVLKNELAIASSVLPPKELIKNTANKKLDPLTAMVYASRTDLPDEAIQNLILTKNDAVLQVLSINSSLPFKFFNEISVLSINSSSKLMSHKRATDAFIKSMVKHNNPLYRVEAAKVYGLQPEHIISLALDNSLDVRKTIFARDNIFEVSPKIIDGNINMKDKTLLLSLINSNPLFTAAHYQILVNNPDVEIRIAIAKNITMEKLFGKFSKTNEQERLAVLRKLSKDTDLEVKAIALGDLTAKEQELAFENTPNNIKAAFIKKLAPKIKSKKLAFEIIESKQDESIQALALNLWMSEEIQNKIVDVYINKYSNFNQNQTESQADEMNSAMQALLNGQAIYASTLDKLSSYCFDHLYPPHFCKQLTQKTLPSASLKKYPNIKNKALKKLMYESIEAQPYVTHTEIIYGLSGISSELKRLFKTRATLPENKFWTILSQSDLSEAHRVAAINVHTPIELLYQLEQSSSTDCSTELLRNPIVPIELKKKIILKKNIFWSIDAIETDFYLSVLNGTTKTEKEFSDEEKAMLSKTLMIRSMAEQF